MPPIKKDKGFTEHVIVKRSKWDALKNDEYNRLRTKQITEANPQVEEMVKLKDKLSNIVSNPNLSNNDMIKLFNDVSLQYRSEEHTSELQSH